MQLYRTFCTSLFIFVALIMCSCNNVQDKLEIQKSASAFDIKQGEASILQSNQHFMKSFDAGDSLEVSQSYTTDALLMAPNQPSIKGRKNIAHFFSNLMAKGITDFDLHTLHIWGDSSIIAEQGTYQISGKKNKLIDKGKYIVLWKPETGNWKMYRDIWASDLPLQIEQPKKKALHKK